MADVIEMELCANCKKEIPQPNYVMHTVHCARNITLCPICKEPFPKSKIEQHKKTHTSTKFEDPPAKSFQSTAQQTVYKSSISKTNQTRVLDNAGTNRKVESSQKVHPTVVPQTIVNGACAMNKPQEKVAQMLSCKYCDLELPKLELEEHENYCGTRTDKCMDCGEFVMFKYKKLHEDSNHGFIKLSDEPGPRASWDSNTQRSSTTSTTESLYSRRSRLPPLRPFDMTPLYDMTDYIPLTTSGRTNSNKTEKGESYKDLSRRLDCKTEYIKNLLHDSASITAPLRTGTSPRNYSHNKGPAPQPPAPRRANSEQKFPCEFCHMLVPHDDLIQHQTACRPDLASFNPKRRSRNPPTELLVPCEFCNTPIPHDDLIQHETGCRPDLARFNPMRRSPSPDDYFVAPQPSSPEVELPCEFCADMFPASQLLRHQATCT